MINYCLYASFGLVQSVHVDLDMYRGVYKITVITS
jgi:hypothetical protein